MYRVRQGARAEGATGSPLYTSGLSTSATLNDATAQNRPTSSCTTDLPFSSEVNSGRDLEEIFQAVADDKYFSVFVDSDHSWTASEESSGFFCMNKNVYFSFSRHIPHFLFYHATNTIDLEISLAYTRYRHQQVSIHNWEPLQLLPHGTWCRRKQLRISSSGCGGCSGWPALSPSIAPF